MNKTLKFTLEVELPEERDSKSHGKYLEDLLNEQLNEQFPYHKIIVTPQKFRYETSEDFPIYFENKDIRVFTNSCGEVFVENIRSNTDIRINAVCNALVFTTTYAIKPVHVGGSIGWQVGMK